MKILLSRWQFPAIFASLLVLYLVQGTLLLKERAAADPKGHAALAAMQAHASGVSLAVMSYMQSHETEAVTQIQQEGRDIARLIDTYRKEALARGNEASYKAVAKAYDDLRQATMVLLAADHAEAKSRQTMAQRGESLNSFMVARTETGVRPTQLNASARLQAILAAAAEARGLVKNAGDTASINASRSRFHQAMSRYAALSEGRSSARWTAEASDLFDQCAAQADDLQAADEKKQSALDRFVQKKNVLDIVLQEQRAASGRGALISLRQIFAPGILLTVAGLILLVLGLGLAWRQSQSPEIAALPRLQNILSCIEAAAAGDVSRIPEPGPPDAEGLLARSAGKLITVLARSENLVYHLAALVESSGEAIISHNLDGTILSWNKGAQRLYGYSADEVKGKSVALLAADSGAPVVEDYLQKLRRSDRVPPFEVIHRARNGRTVNALVRVSAILDSTRRIIGASFSVQELPENSRLGSRQENNLA